VLDYAKELLSLRTEIESLKQTIATVVAQLKTEITSLLATNHTTETNTMDIETATTPAAAPHPTQLKITSLLSELKHEIVTTVIETRALLPQQHNITKMNTKNLHSKT